MDTGADLPDDWAALWSLIRRVAGLMDRAGEQLFRAELNVSLAQFLVLSVVDAHPGPLNQQAVADRLGLTKGTISRQIDTAVAAGLMRVDVSAHSRRENTVALTPQGAQVVRRGDLAFSQSRESMAAGIPDADVRASICTLATLVDRLNAQIFRDGN